MKGGIKDSLHEPGSQHNSARRAQGSVCFAWQRHDELSGPLAHRASGLERARNVFYLFSQLI
jgi:hypothetical protein